MYKKDLLNLLNKENFPNFFLLYGGDNFQVEIFSEFIQEKYKVDECLKLYFEEYDFKIANDFLSNLSLFSEKKLLKIKSYKKINSKELKALIELCKNSNDNYFLLEFYDESSKLTELEKIFENNFVRFFKPSNQKEAIELLSLKAKRLNVNITYNALYALYINFEENLYLASSELNKFKDLSINEQHIEKYCFSLSTAGFESFFNKLLNKEEFTKDIQDLLENFNEIAFLNYLSSNFYRLFKINTYIKLNGNADLKNLLGYTLPAQVANDLIKKAISLNLNKYKKIFDLILDAEYELKTNSKLNKKEFLISIILNLSKIIKSTP